MNRFIGLVAACVVATTPLTAFALDTKQPIRVVTAFPAGGVTDIAARIVADAMAKDLKQTVIVENKPGGDGITGMLEVVNAKPDGNTLLSGGFGGQLIPPLIKKNFPVNVETQLVPISRTAGFSNILVVAKDAPYKTVDELIAYAKAHPGEINFGSAASTSSDRLTTEMFMQRTGVELTHVPYKGGAAALNDLSSGVIQMMFANLPAALGLIEGGNIRALAVTAGERQPQLPNVPTLQEAGIPDFVVTSWLSVYGPAGMSPADVKTLSDAYVAAVRKPEVQEALRKVGFSPIGEDSAAFAKSAAEEKVRWKAVIDAARLAE